MSTSMKWVIALLVLIVVLLAGPWVMDRVEEASCDGRIQVHTLTGRRICDRFPWADSLSDMDFESPNERTRDYWLD